MPHDLYPYVYYPDYCYGPFYALSFSNLYKIVKNIENVPYFDIEDVYITGLIAEKVSWMACGLGRSFYLILSHTCSGRQWGRDRVGYFDVGFGMSQSQGSISLLDINRMIFETFKANVRRAHLHSVVNVRNYFPSDKTYFSPCLFKVSKVVGYA